MFPAGDPVIRINIVTIGWAQPFPVSLFNMQLFAAQNSRGESVVWDQASDRSNQMEANARNPLPNFIYQITYTLAPGIQSRLAIPDTKNSQI